MAACLPASYTATPALGLLAGGAAGALAATTVERRSDRALAIATHALAGLVGACVSRAAHARR
jgi:outer membrane lipoprotein SlyB